ncbi:MAG: ABC transporter permease, partial [Calditrichia bacterium]
FLLITLAALFRPGILMLALLLSLTGWLEIARITRGEALSIKTRDFILAAKGLGLGRRRIFFHHLLPNVINPVLILTPLKIGEVIMLESALSFLGIGVQPPLASWGNIINDGRPVLFEAWWISLFPGMAILLTVWSFHIIGEFIRERLMEGQVEV